MSFNKTLWKPPVDVTAAIEKGDRRLRRRNYLRSMSTRVNIAQPSHRPAAPATGKPR
jgi:hypothetical protein